VTVVAKKTNNDQNVSLERPKTRKFNWDWLGVAPFFLFATLFLFLPSISIFVRSFQTRAGEFTFDNIISLFTVSDIANAYKTSLTISLITAIGGALFGFLLAYAIVLGGLPGFLRAFLVTFAGVASNFAGVPLAFAFVATIGNAGLVTRMIENIFDVNLRAMGWSIYNVTGLSIVYMYFQFPLMVLIIAPAIDGLKREWREASEILGANSFQYWRYVALPVLWPSLLGTTLLLFANAFGAVATAYGLTGSSLNIVTILLFAQIRGDVLHDPHLGYALAFGMILITGISNGLFIWLRTRSERWLR